MKPIIAIASQTDEKYYGVKKEYIRLLEKAGANIVLLPIYKDKKNVKRTLSHVDGLLIPGGVDVDPSCYGAERTPECGESDHGRDRCEKAMIEYAVKHDMPVLGICRGEQSMNVFMGGSLHQDINSDGVSSDSHFQQEPFNEPCHNVEIIPNTPLAHILGEGPIQVNSLHHQCVWEIPWHNNIVCCAVSEDSVIEAIASATMSFFVGVQWHPELMPKSESTQALVKAFLSAAKEYAKKRKS